MKWRILCYGNSSANLGAVDYYGDCNLCNKCKYLVGVCGAYQEIADTVGVEYVWFARMENTPN